MSAFPARLAARPTPALGPAPTASRHPAASRTPAARHRGATTAPGRRAPGTTAAALLIAAAASGISGPSLALPTAAHALRVPTASAAWLMTAYGLGLLAGTPLLSGTAGRRGPAALVRAGAALVALGAAIVLASPSALLPLAAGRAVEAAGAAGLTVAAFRIAGRDRTGRSTGLVAIGNAAGGTLGLFVGAGAAQLLGWRAALVMPLLALAVLPAVLRPAGPAGRAAQALQAGEAGEAGSPRPRLREALPLGLLRRPGFRRPALLMLALATVNFALVYGAPRRVTALTGWGPLPTGAAVASAALAGALLSWQLVRLAPALGTGRVRVLLAAGSTAAAAAAAFAPWPPVVLLGSALSALVTARGQGVLTGSAVGGLAPERQGGAIGLFNLAFPAGVAAGPALAGFADQTVQFLY
ncbi:MFS transporter [Kitasatospora purpeofusca]|uniref:MFS transporter n=1 Tax=Kitasatospora purpeofusca TaxID=67352 RepID=UPI00224DB58B|nr:MFS transporter [Kitasatospora purpeofusca]MCX4755782.1 MFS transporter [Kitasatospora purpeofusca]WSR36359.1 MFS transporter [Kitasatospora purpeofusca]